jgi:hypothetical protein
MHVFRLIELSSSGKSFNKYAKYSPYYTLHIFRAISYLFQDA